jgi:hypothetical protein
MLAFDKDKFIPGTVSASVWVTRQHKRLKSFDPTITAESAMFKLLNQMDGDVNLQVRNVVRDSVQLSVLINALEDIAEYTRFGRRNVPYNSNMSSKNSDDKSKTSSNASEDKSKDISSKPNSGKCSICNDKGHNSRSCPKSTRKMANVVEEDQVPEFVINSKSEEDTQPQPDFLGALEIRPENYFLHPIAGGNRTVIMSCNDKPCDVLLDSGAFKSVIGDRYLSKMNPNWEKFIFAQCRDKFHSFNSSIETLGIIRIRLKFLEHTFVTDFVVIKDAITTKKQFSLAIK